MWEREVKLCRSFRMCLKQYDYQYEASRFSYGLINILENQVNHKTKKIQKIHRKTKIKKLKC